MADKVKTRIRLKNIGVNGNPSAAGVNRISEFQKEYGSDFIGHEYEGNDLVMYVYRPTNKKIKYNPETYNDYREETLSGENKGYYFKLDDNDNMYIVYDNSGRVAPSIRFGRSALDRINKRLITSFLGDGVDIFYARSNSPQDSPAVLGDGYSDRTKDALQSKNGFITQYKSITGRDPSEEFINSVMKNIKVDSSGSGSYKIGSKTIHIDNAELLKSYQHAISSESTRNIRDMLNVSKYIDRKTYDEYTESMKDDMSTNSYIGLGLGAVSGIGAAVLSSPFATPAVGSAIGGATSGAVSEAVSGLLNRGNALKHLHSLYNSGLDSIHNKYVSMQANDDSGADRDAILAEYQREVNSYKNSFIRMMDSTVANLDKQWGYDTLAGTATGAAFSAALPYINGLASKWVVKPMTNLIVGAPYEYLSGAVSNSSYATKRALVQGIKAFRSTDKGLQTALGVIGKYNPVTRTIGAAERALGRMPVVGNYVPQPIEAPKPFSALGKLAKIAYNDFRNEPLDFMLRTNMNAPIAFEAVGDAYDALINGGTNDAVYNSLKSTASILAMSPKYRFDSKYTPIFSTLMNKDAMSYNLRNSLNLGVGSDQANTWEQYLSPNMFSNGTSMNPYGMLLSFMNHNDYGGRKSAESRFNYGASPFMYNETAIPYELEGVKLDKNDFYDSMTGVGKSVVSPSGVVYMPNQYGVATIQRLSDDRIYDDSKLAEYTNGPFLKSKRPKYWDVPLISPTLNGLSGSTKLEYDNFNDWNQTIYGGKDDRFVATTAMENPWTDSYASSEPSLNILNSASNIGGMLGSSKANRLERNIDALRAAAGIIFKTKNDYLSLPENKRNLKEFLGSLAAEYAIDIPDLLNISQGGRSLTEAMSNVFAENLATKSTLISHANTINGLKRNELTRRNLIEKGNKKGKEVEDKIKETGDMIKKVEESEAKNSIYGQPGGGALWLYFKKLYLESIIKNKKGN